MFNESIGNLVIGNILIVQLEHYVLR